jgi:hypothetical protein
MPMTSAITIVIGSIVSIFILRKLYKYFFQSKPREIEVHPIEAYVKLRSSIIIGPNSMYDHSFCHIRENEIAFLICLTDDESTDMNNNLLDLDKRIESIWSVPFEIIHRIVEGSFHDKFFLRRFLNKDIIHNMLMRYTNEHP